MDTHDDTLMLKTYTTELGQAEYRHEIAGFRSMRGADGIVNFYGSYIHGENYNIMLEHANRGSLEEYLRNEEPPARAKDIIQFWEGMFELIRGLKTVHSVRDVHLGIEPKNVLVYETPTGLRFKLASCGGRQPMPHASNGEFGAANNDRVCGYRAPECYVREFVDHLTNTTTKVTWQADVWSLGCLYSEAAIWLADGYKGVFDYRKERESQLQRIHFKGGDSFHDGIKVLNVILDNHRDIEDRLRTSDYITKDVLDTMVEEMLWEEDRPTANALSKKAEMVLNRANKALAASQFDQGSQPPSRPVSRQGRRRLPPRPPIPTKPLPALPQDRPLPAIPQDRPPRISSRSSERYAERHGAPSVEKWRQHVRPGAPSRTDTLSTSYSTLSSSTTTSGLSQSTNMTDLDRDLVESVTTWSITDTMSQGSVHSTLPILTTPFHKNVESLPASHRARTLRKMKSSLESGKTPSSTMPDGLSPAHKFASPDVLSPSPPDLQSSKTIGSPSDLLRKNSCVGDESQGIAPGDIHPLLRAAEAAAANRISQASSYSIIIANDTQTGARDNTEGDEPILPIPPRSARRAPPQNTYLIFPPQPSAEPKDLTHGPAVVSAGQASDEPSLPADLAEPVPQQLPRSVPSFPSTISTEVSFPSTLSTQLSFPSTISTDLALSIPSCPPTPTVYLTLQTVLDWKNSHLKARKKQQSQRLPGSSLLERLTDREHTFIVDDSTSMSMVWPNVKETFSGLSYIVKPMAPDGVELYFCNSYTSWRRKNTQELCKLLDAQKLTTPLSFAASAGLLGRDHTGTDIAHRLHIQLEDYMMRVRGIKVFAGPAANKRKEKDKIRPASFYVLTNGQWCSDAVEKCQKSIFEVASFLALNGFEEGMVTVNFISFAETETAIKNFEDVVRGPEEGYAIDIVTSTPWQGNVLSMLLGAVNPTLDPSLSGGRDVDDRSTRSSVMNGRLRSGSGSFRSGGKGGVGGRLFSRKTSIESFFEG